MVRPRPGWKWRAGIVIALPLVALATPQLEWSRMAPSASAADARVESPWRVSAESPSRISVKRLMEDVQTLSSPAFEGRLTGSPGNHRAQAFILRRFREIGLKPLGPLGSLGSRSDGAAYEQPFPFTHDGLEGLATNLIGSVEGSAEPGRFTTLTAHYDHLGVRDGRIYPGADDNASGVATLLAAAGYFMRHRPRRSMLFIAFDGEEEGLQGSLYFVAHPPVALSAITLEVSLDMVSRGDRNELVVAGTYFSPELKAPLEAIARGRRLTLIFGHDRPIDLGGAAEDWTHSSDHGPFHDAGIPFLYFGVEDHPDYHRPTDTADRIPRAFFGEASNLIVDTLLAFDAR